MDKYASTSNFSFCDREMPVRMGRHHLFSRIDADPVGEEFLAAWGVDEGVEQLRVVRCIYPTVAEESEFVALFSEEARALSRLSNANVVRIIEVGQEGPVPFVAREYVEGISLARLIELAVDNAALWSWEIAVHVIAEILRGLDYVHRREDIYGRPMGMRHGDVRPGNIIISFDGEVKLTNFGTSLRFIVDERTNARLGELRMRYLPPEGDDPNEPTVGADLWGASLILLILLGERLPTSYVNSDGVIWAPPQMTNRVESMPPVLDMFLGRALNAQPTYRFETAAEMRHALINIMRDNCKGHPPDELSKWVQTLGKETRIAEQELIRTMLGKEAEIKIEDTTDGVGMLGPGTVLDGRYHLLRLLGEGGMGMVYEAEHLGLSRKVGLKVLHDRVLEDASTVERFKREAKIIGTLGHPNIVAATDFGISGEGYHFLAMELLDGDPLSKRIAERSIAPRELAEVMAQVCDGLEAAHNAGVIHRDLKPDNIFITSTGARILDFGIAKSTGLNENSTALTKTGNICGTVDYIAPEQIRGVSQDPRSDLYAVGVIIYEALTGVTPFRGRTIGEALHKAINDKLVPPRKRTNDKTIPPELEAICIKALHRKADKRYGTASEMSAALRALLPDTNDTSEGTELIVSRFIFKNEMVVGFIVTLLLLTGSLALGKMYLSKQEHSASDIVVEYVDQKASESEEKLVDDRSGFNVINVNTVESVANDVISEEKDNGENDENGEIGKPQKINSEDNQASQENDIKLVKTNKSKPQKSQQSKTKKHPPATNEKNKTTEAKDRSAEKVKDAEAFYSRMQLDLAEKSFAEAVKQNSRNSAGWFGIGKVAFQKGDYQKAIKKTNRALRYAPGNAKYRNFLGKVFLASGDKEKAIEQWERVLMTNPNNKEAKKLLMKVGVIQ